MFPWLVGDGLVLTCPAAGWGIGPAPWAFSTSLTNLCIAWFDERSDMGVYAIAKVLGHLIENLHGTLLAQLIHTFAEIFEG